MKLMSFALTTAQFEARTKTETRRLGWANLKPGEIVMGVEKGQGIPKGGKVNRLHPFKVVSNHPECLENIDKAAVIREGFPDMSPWDFVMMFCKHNGCKSTQIVNVIRFEHLDTP